MNKEDYEAHKEDYRDHNVSCGAFVSIQDVYIRILEAQLKAKDEEIKELGEIVQQYLIPSKNYDAIIKAKDDEIRRLNNLYADTIKDLGDALIEIERLKEHITHLQNVYMKLDGKYLKLKTELEELQHRSCESCVHRSFIDETLTNKVTNGFCMENGFFTKVGFCCSRYESKEQ